MNILRMAKPEAAACLHINLLHFVAYNPFPPVLILNIVSPFKLIFPIEKLATVMI